MAEILWWIFFDLLWPFICAIILAFLLGAAGYWLAGDRGGGIGMIVGLLCGAAVDYWRYRRK